MTQGQLGFPWSGYGWITVKGRRLFALVYRAWNAWFAQASDNPSLKRDRWGTVATIQEFGELVEPLTMRKDLPS